MNELYYSADRYWRERFAGQKILKIPLNAGFSCPNKDGTLSTSGCIFCDPLGAGPLQTNSLTLEKQIVCFIAAHPGKKYVAYFQAHSNTYAPVAELKKKFSAIFSFPDILGLSIGTRPDTINKDVLALLGQLRQRTYVAVELGLQSVHDRSLRFLNRNHSYAQFLTACDQLRSQRIDIIVHLILGIPGEKPEDVWATVAEMNRLQPAGIKVHPLHVLRETPLFEIYQQGKITLLTKEEYIALLIGVIERLRPEIAIHRLTGERERQLFHAPKWALNKWDVLHSLHRKMKEKATHQGRLFLAAGAR